MRLWLSDKRQRDWIVAAVLAAASLLQVSLTPAPAGQQALAALFAVATCATVAFRQRYPATAGVTAQGLMALDFLTWHNLAAGGWTIAWFCSLYGLAVWSSRWRFVAGAAFVGLTDLSPVGRDADPAHWDSTAIGFALGTVVVMLLLRRIVGDRDTPRPAGRTRAGRRRPRGGRRGARQDRARTSRRGGAQRLDDGHPGRRRAARHRGRLDPRGAADHRADRPRRADRDAAAGRHAADRILRAARPAADAGRPAYAHDPGQRGRPAGGVPRRRRAPRTARRHRAVRVPDRAGGADQRAQARWPGARLGRRALRSRLARARDRRRRRRDAGRRPRRRARTGRHPGAGQPVRGRVRRVGPPRRRLRRPRPAAAG